MAFIVLSTLLKGVVGDAATGTAALGGMAFVAVVPGLAGTDLEATGAPGVLAGVVAAWATLGVEETGVPGLAAGVEVTGFGAAPGPEAAGGGDLTPALTSGADLVVGLLVEADDDGVVCLGAAAGSVCLRSAIPISDY
jgi:hypothetical protein